MPQLFAYGTLKEESVQRSTFGRRVRSRPAEIIGYVLSKFTVLDPDFVRRSGKAEHAIVIFTGRAKDQVAGVVLELTERELLESDEYEPAGYRRVRAELSEGGQAWVYAADPGCAE